MQNPPKILKKKKKKKKKNSYNTTRIIVQISDYNDTEPVMVNMVKYNFNTFAAIDDSSRFYQHGKVQL